METIKVGLIRGRHEMPVDKYIVEEVNNVFDFQAVSAAIADFLEKEVGVSQSYGIALNQNDGNDVLCFKGDKHLVVYVTGLTSVVAEVIRLCAINGISLSLMHYDRDSDSYREQRIF